MNLFRLSILLLDLSLAYGASEILQQLQAKRTTESQDLHGKYNGVRMLRLFPSSSYQIKSIQKYEQEHHPNVEILKVGQTKRREMMDVLIDDDNIQSMIDLIEFLQIPHETLSEDMQHVIEMFSAKNKEKSFAKGNKGFDLGRYHNYKEIIRWLQKMEREHHDLMTLFNIGETTEGRPILVAKISGLKAFDTTARPAVWLDAGIHSNEWIGPATLLYFVSELLTAYGKDSKISELLDTFDVYVLPVLNPDGYHYTWTHDRLWRKSRSGDVNSTCMGTDLNRNWPFMWGTGESSSSEPCRRTYSGPQPASEPEVVAIINFLERIKGSLKLYIAYHSFSQCWMIPYSFTPGLPADYHQLMLMSREAVNAIREVHGTEYSYGTVSSLMGHASGSSVDYVYHQLGVKYTFGVELRDEGMFGPLLPPEQIIPSGQESLAGVIKVMSIIKEELDQ